MPVKLVTQKFVDGFMLLIQPISNLLAAWKIHPNLITVTGLLLSVFAGLEFYLGKFVAAGILLVLSGICDVLDGKLARSTDNASKYGALFDSSMDRYSEFFVFMGLIAYYRHSAVMVALLVFTLAGSVMTSYVRARSEGLGIDCKVGIMQRPERLTYLSAGAIFSFLWSGIMVIAILIVAVFSNITAIQRIIHSYKVGGDIDKNF